MFTPETMKKGTAKPPCYCAYLLLLVAETIRLGNGLSHIHKVFPAAQVEVYTENSVLLCYVKAEDVKFVKVGPDSTNDVVDAAIGRFQSSLRYFPDFKEDYKENPLNLELTPLQRVEIHVLSNETKLDDETDESYGISIDDSSVATLTSATIFGAVRALQTLRQLLEFGWMSQSASRAGDGSAIFVIPSIPIYIADSPSFSYRGLMIDTARHYLPMNLILHNLDAMEMNKLNVLHWHITDSQSFPYQTQSYPELAEKGAYHPKLIYTTSDIMLVVHEAYLRGIRVIPELDLPGHSNAIGKARPDLLAHCPDPSEPVDPTNPEVYDFVETIYRDLSDIFPDSYVHVGGDEVNFDCWNNTKSIREWMEKNNVSTTVELYEYFETRLLHIVSDKLSKTPIVWQEVFNLNLTMSDRTIVDVWKGFDKNTVEQATKQSHRVILSGCWYLDHLKDTWQTFYDCNPRNFNGTLDLMVGGHASMWGEHVDASNFISRVWPRASAVAERLWTGDVTVGGAKQTVSDRIHRFRCLMVQVGISASPTGPGVCPHEVPYKTVSATESFTAELDTNAII